ncbi:Transforming acidic coiled-coil-containing protein 3 [Mortierella sp. GBA35]|nr:Transforming acidic coiled-coil-containing protein 3 [Mortierella sp. GBA35]
MDPEDSPELPPLKRGTYDLDAILAAAENAEFAIPPPATKTSFNSNPFASSTPSAFRSSFNTSSAPSINNSPYPTTTNDDNDTPTPPAAPPKAVPASRPKPLTRKPLASSSSSTASTTPARARVSTLKSTLSKFSAPKKADLEPTIAENDVTSGGGAADGTFVQDHGDNFNNNTSNSYNNSNNSNYIGNGNLSEDQAAAGAGASLNDEANNSMTIVSPTPSNGSSSGGIFKSSRPLRTVPFNRVGSPGAHLDSMGGTTSPSRSGSPVNVSSGSIGGLAGNNDLGVYSTPSSSRPTSRPTSRPNSRISSTNGKYNHSRQLSSDSLASFNAMIGKEDPMGMGGDDDDDIDLHHSGHVSFVVSDPEHLRILEGEIEDPFSPSMSAIDPDADAYLSNLMQQGQSPAFRSRRQRNADSNTSGGVGGDESFVDSTDDALSDKEHPKFRNSRTGTRTPSSPLARAVTRGSSHSPRDHSNSSGLLSLDQVMSDSQGMDEMMDSSFLNGSGGRSFTVGRKTSSNADKESLSGRSPPVSNGTTQPSLEQQQLLSPVPGIENGIHPLDHQLQGGSNLHSPSAAATSPGANGLDDHDFLDPRAHHQEFERQDPVDINHVEVDIVVQNVNVHDEPESRNQQNNINSNNVHLLLDDSDLDDSDSIHYNDHSVSEALANEEMQLHDSLDIHESHAQSFADWMSSSAEISRLDISPPVSHPPGMLLNNHYNHLPLPSFGAAMSSSSSGLSTDMFPVPPTYVPLSTSPQGTSLMASTTLGDASLLTSSYTPTLSSPEATFASPQQSQKPQQQPPSPSLTTMTTTTTTSPMASKKAQILEKRSHLLEDLLSKARERTKNKTGAIIDREKAVAAANAAMEATSSTSSPPTSSSKDSELGSVTTNGHSVKFAVTEDVGPNSSNENDSRPQEDDVEGGSGSAANLSVSIDRKEGGLVRRPSGMLLSSRIRDSTNLDAPRYSIREMEDMKKNVRMDLRIEITNEIREEYERSAEQEAAIFQFEIEELRTALETERREKSQLKSVLDEFESSLADIAVGTAKEIQTIKEQNSRLTESKEETEEAFILLKTRYDELKALNQKHVENEGILRNAVEALKQDFETSESRYEKVKAHADAKFVVASQEMEQSRIVFENEVAMLKAQLSRQEMQMRTLEQALEIKNKENEDLILFSEELIAKLS